MKKNTREEKLLKDALKHNDSDHKHPSKMTRRELLGQGFIAGSGMMLAPTLLGMLSKKAMAQEMGCAISSLNPKIGFLSIDLAGGGNIGGGNVIVGGPGGQMDALSAAGYTTLGYAPNTSTQTDNTLGILFQADSAFLRGIKSKASAEAMVNTNGAVACTRLANDTENNTQNPIYGIAKAGAEGGMASLMGTRNSTSGGKSQSPNAFIDLAIKPTLISRDSQLTGAVDSGKMANELGGVNVINIFRRIANLSAAKKAKLTDEVVKKDILQCGYEGAKNTLEVFGSPDSLNVRLDEDLITGANSIFSTNDLRNDRYNKAATYSKAIVNGYVGAGVMELGGFDYHNGTRSTGEQRDFDAGVAMGAAIEYAHRQQKKLIVYVFSDGGVRSDGAIDNSTDGRGKGVWRRDSSTNAAALMLIYNPNGRVQMTAIGNQMGNYNADGSVNSGANLVSNSASNLAYWVVLNYMALNGDVGKFAATFPQNPFGSSMAQLDPYINFQAAA
jgi:hypothetical protein